jgi:hypothetical protein
MPEGAQAQERGRPSTQSEQVRNQRKTVPRSQQPKALAARIAALEAETASLRAMLADERGNAVLGGLP